MNSAIKVVIAGGAVLICAAAWPHFQKNAGDEAAERFEMGARHGYSVDEECREAGAVADAYLSEGDEGNYAHWRERERLSCISARLCRTIVGGCPE